MIFIVVIIILVFSAIIVNAIQSAQFTCEKIGMGELFENFLIRIKDYQTENISVNQLAVIPEVFRNEASKSTKFSFLIDYKYYMMLYEAIRFATDNFENEELMTLIQLYATTNIEINETALENAGITLCNHFMAKCRDFNIIVQLSAKGIERRDDYNDRLK